MDEYGTNDLERIMKGEGVHVRPKHPWTPRFGDMYLRPIIYLPQVITTAQRRTAIAHCLGHHFMHEANQIWLGGYDRIWNWKQERQAEEFAAFLTIPEEEGPYIQGLPGSEVARIYKVSEELVRVRGL